MGALNLLTVLFVVLKIVGVEPIAGWSWWYVALPTLIWINILIIFWTVVFLIKSLK